MVPAMPSTRLVSRASGMPVVLPRLLLGEGASGSKDDLLRACPRVNTGGSPRACSPSTELDDEREPKVSDDGARRSTCSSDDGVDAVELVTTEIVGRMRDGRRRSGWKTGAGSGSGVGVIVRRCMRLKVASLAVVVVAGGAAGGDASCALGHGAICCPINSLGAVDASRTA